MPSSTTDKPARQRGMSFRVSEQVKEQALPTGTTALGVADAVVRLFGPELLARCRQRDQEVTRG